MIDEHGGGAAGDEFGYPRRCFGRILASLNAFARLRYITAARLVHRSAVIVLSKRDRARDAALNLMRFFADESCGQCTPAASRRPSGSSAQKHGIYRADELSRAMADASICGLGGRPGCACVIRYFPRELE